ncbi:MAG: prepilin-type N-terminal cleavage/methylation domain-containing protein [Gammaproteobacteria bacterium]|nr:prepilin-type N-terminal cleavage/methylation domain-containing protein [Gammaproteobacteria bacterium]
MKTDFQIQNKRSLQSGFTLLEVMIALTITAMVLGSLFALAAGSKQLAFRTQDSLQESTAARAAVNFAVLDNQFREIDPAIDDDRYSINGLDVLPDAERRTSAMNDLLQEYEVVNQRTGDVIRAVRWQRFDLPQ